MIEEHVDQIAKVLYEYDHSLGFCGHDIDGDAMRSIIKTIVFLYKNPNIDVEDIRNKGIDANKAGESLREIIKKLNVCSIKYCTNLAKHDTIAGKRCDTCFEISKTLEKEVRRLLNL